MNMLYALDRSARGKLLPALVVATFLLTAPIST
jgi:hypothetical protein